jgi:hypothetical protein
MHDTWRSWAFNAFIGRLAHPTTPWHEDAGIMLFRASAAAFSPFAVTLSVLLSLWPSTCLVQCRLRHKVLSNPCVLAVISTSILSRSRQHVVATFPSASTGASVYPRILHSDNRFDSGCSMYSILNSRTTTETDLPGSG